jgi:transcriptional regulator with GAF, ATPase, and Fis domain
MRRVFSLLERVAPTDTTVLIEAETGTGKELAAEAIHEESPRAGGPFVVFDCSAVSANLMESELFGHVRGAFTGAVGDRVGAFEAADGGTLFLDEIGELSLDLQPKLLRVLESLEVRRVGANTVREVDVRIVAATNRSLAAEVDAGRFREDLYYRLAVVRLNLPPLRERLDDIPMLVEHFASELARRGQPATHLPEAVIRGFVSQAWPGNIRELRNAVARAISLGPAGAASATGAPAVMPDHPVDLAIPLKIARERVADAFEVAYITELLKKTGGNVSHAAELAGVNRKFVQRAMKRHGLRGRDDD